MKDLALLWLLTISSLFVFGCGDDDPAEPEIPHFDVSGRVYTYYGGHYGNYDADNVRMAFTDSEHNTRIVRTDHLGNFTVAGLAAGLVTIDMSGDTILTDFATQRALAQYQPQSDFFTLSQDTVINFQIREFEMVFGDGGAATYEWAWEYGVRNDGEKYIFWHDIRGSDMRMRRDIAIPHNITQIGFILLGESAPSYMSWMDVELVVDGDEQDAGMRLFDTEEGYWIQPLDADALKSTHLHLNLEYHRDAAEYVYIKTIILYIY